MKTLFVLLSLISLNSLYAKEAIQWPVMDWQPVMILFGPNQNKGMIDWYLNYFQKHLPQYEHINVEMNFARSSGEIKKRQKFCSILSLKTKEREEQMNFSIPYLILSTPNIIMSQKAWKSLGSPSKYSLKKLAANEKYKGLIEDARSYTQEFDKVINESMKNNNLEKRIIRSDNIKKMLKMGRIDYTIEYPFVMFYETDQDMVEVQIEEIPPYALAYVACPKTQWGEKVILDLNPVIKNGIKEARYREHMIKWLSQKSKNMVVKNYEVLLK